MVKTRKQKLVTKMMVGLVLMVPIITCIAVGSNAEGISKACRNSVACMAAVSAEQEANSAAIAANNTANAYQIKVSELTAEIAAKQVEIAETEAQIAEVNADIATTEAKLARQRTALAELLVSMHLEGNDEPIMILAGSSSIADLAEKQTRSEVIEEQISAMAAKIKEEKEALEEKRARAEALLEQQKNAKNDLEASRVEQQAIVAKYKNNAVAYEAVAAEAREAQKAAEKAEQEAHPELYSGSSYTGYNTYPWQGDCPVKQDYYLTYWNGYKLGGYVCECVSYVGWKAYEAHGLYLAWGNAYNWDDAARAYGYTVNHTPATDTIGQVDGYPYGHVFWVEGVNADGSINVTEYNNAYSTYLYSGNYRYGDFGARKISASEVSKYNYIHF